MDRETKMTSHRPTKPKRQRKADRILHSGVTQDEIKCDYALGPFDRMAVAMDHKWGIDRLVELVSPDMAQRYGAAMAKLNAAIDDQDPEQVTLRAGVCMRGMQAMDQAATESGAQPASDEMWLLHADGMEYGLLRDARAWQRVQDKHPDVTLVSEREMVLAIAMYQQSVTGKTIAAVRSSFPKADVIKITNKNLEDEIPW